MAPREPLSKFLDCRAQELHLTFKVCACCCGAWKGENREPRKSPSYFLCSHCARAGVPGSILPPLECHGTASDYSEARGGLRCPPDMGPAV